MGNMASWTEVMVDSPPEDYTIALEDLTDGQLSDPVYGKPSQLLYSLDLRAAIARTKLIPYNADEPHEFLYICLKTGPIYDDEKLDWSQFWLFTIDENTDDLLLTIADLIEKHRQSHNRLIENLRNSLPEISTPQFTSEADTPYYDTELTPYHSHTPTGHEQIIEGTLVGYNLQPKHSFALECSECGRTTTQPEPSSTLHLVKSDTLAPMRPRVVGSRYWVCNEHSVRSLSEVPHLPEKEWLEGTSLEEKGAGSSGYADEHLLVACNLEWLALGHPRGEMGVLTCRDPEILDREPVN